MKPFVHFNAKTIDDCVSKLAEYKGRAVVIAGGTDLLDVLKNRILQDYPTAIVNMKTIPNLDGVKEDAEGLKIGALTKLSDIAESPIVKGRYSVLAQAAGAVASPHIRNMATIGGNLCQDTRCWYYRYPHHIGGRITCIAKGGAACYAIIGDNRYHSIFGAKRLVHPSCISDCPASVDIPSYLSNIRDGNLYEAARILLDFNPIPAITGRVCPHFCEQECNRGEFDEPVSIRYMERFVGDYILENASKIMKTPGTNTEKSVAIVGSGPAGLSAAYYLRRLGHRVTVFDMMEEAGGMLTYSIPTYRLPNDVVRKQIKALESMGIEFKVKINVGTDVTLENLKKNFDSIFLASGTWAQRTLGIEDEQLLLSGLQFLSNVKLGSRQAPGRKVLVIGGGNVAIDVAITALRLGTEEVTLACLESREEMPAIQWEVEQAIAEGVKLMPSWGPSRILKASGKVSGMELVRCISVFDNEEHFCPAFDNSVKETVEADQIILAIGQEPDLSFADPSLKVERGLIVVDQTTHATNIPGMFAGGDVTSGPASVIAAVASGRRAADSIDHYIKGIEAQGEDKSKETDTPFQKFNSGYLKRTSRVQMPELPISQRSVDTEDALGLGLSDIEMEANRCFNCGCVAVSPSDIATALIALDAKIKTTKRTIEAERLFTGKPTKPTILEPDEIITEIQIPTPKPSSKQIYLKFRLRKSIDFAIAAVACVIHMDSEKINDSRIVLGAVAPIPLRVRETEDFLKGREPSEEVAEAGARLAAKGANPLAKNTYKVVVIKALVKKAILATLGAETEVA